MTILALTRCLRFADWRFRRSTGLGSDLGLRAEDAMPLMVDALLQCPLDCRRLRLDWTTDWLLPRGRFRPRRSSDLRSTPDGMRGDDEVKTRRKRRHSTPSYVEARAKQITSPCTPHQKKTFFFTSFTAVEAAAASPSASPSPSPLTDMENGQPEAVQADASAVVAPISAPPVFLSPQDHDAATSATPASFADIPPRLVLDLDAVRIQLECEDAALGLRSYPAGHLWLTEQCVPPPYGPFPFPQTQGT